MMYLTLEPVDNGVVKIIEDDNINAAGEKYESKIVYDLDAGGLERTTQLLQDVVLDSVDKYRFVVLSDNNLNVSNEVLIHNLNNSDLIFVNLGDDPFRSQIVDLATATGGTTYDAISANDLTMNQVN